jgi:phenylacetate-CoA ligase
MPRDVARQSLGWVQTANSVSTRARERVPAYRRFLEARGVPEDAPFSELPITDKASYLIPAPYADLLADDSHETFTIHRSSGAFGSSFRWPQLKADYRWSARRLRAFLESTFRIHERRTVAVVALSLGSWVGGDHYSWCLKNVALEAPYPFAVFSPGNRHEEVLEFLRQPQPAVEQFLVVICPSLLGYLLLLAESTGRPLPLHQMRYLAIGEAFPEALRESLRQRAGLGGCEPFMFSLYGSADTGALGVESPASVALRQLLADVPDLAAELGLGPVVPHFFHNTATDAYYETVDGELCVTRWQGIPLVRYNLHDSAKLLSWEPVRQALIATRPRDPRHAEWMNLLHDAQAMPDLVALSGRADSCLVLGGTKLTEAMLDEAVRCPELSDLVTGTYRASLIVEQERPILAMDLQFRQGVLPDAAALHRAYHGLIQALGRVQPEFASDWQNLYRNWDDDPSRRVLRLRGLAWPALSEDAGERIKQRSLT